MIPYERFCTVGDPLHHRDDGSTEATSLVKDRGTSDGPVSSIHRERNNPSESTEDSEKRPEGLTFEAHNSFDLSGKFCREAKLG